MKLYRFTYIVFLSALLVTCGTSTPGQQPASQQTTPSTGTVLPTSTLEPRTVEFVTQDGVTLRGQIYGGKSKVAVVCSWIPSSSWEPLARHLAARGYMVLTYEYRGLADLALLERDMQAAFTFVQKEGATTIASVGASIGGTHTARLAAKRLPPFIVGVAISSPVSYGNVQISDEELRSITMPFLFLNSEGDTFIQDTKHMFATVKSSSKELHIYSGAAHGGYILDTEHKDEMIQHISNFLLAHAPGGP
jgi:esterase/lipase